MMALQAASVHFRGWVIDRLDGAVGVTADGLTANCPTCGGNGRMVVVFAGTAPVVDLLCVDGCSPDGCWDALRGRRA